jgi:hypothetical protein
VKQEKTRSQSAATDEGAGPETEAEQSDASQTQAAARFDEAAGDLAEQTQAMNTESLVCDARDLILTLFKERPKPWSQMLEEEQTDIASAVEMFCEAMVSSIVTFVAAKGQHTITARLEKFTGKSGEYQATLKMNGEPELALDLAKFAGKAVLLVDADAATFYGIRAAETEANAPELFNEPEPVGEPVDLEAAAEA